MPNAFKSIRLLSKILLVILSKALSLQIPMIIDAENVS